MHYIKRTLVFGIKYQQSPNEQILHGFSDADWAGNKDTRRSTSGYCFLLAGRVISWSSKKQQSVALSSTESEYMALAKATAKAIWLRKLLCELGFPQSNPTTIYCDSQSAIALSENPRYHSRSKYVDTQYHFTRGKVLAHEIQLPYVSTSDMTADILTKSLLKDKHQRCMTNLGMCSIPASQIHALTISTKHFGSSLPSFHLCGSYSQPCIYGCCPIRQSHQLSTPDDLLSQFLYLLLHSFATASNQSSHFD